MMESWTAAMAVPPSPSECVIAYPESRTVASTPSSSTSGCVSADDSECRHGMPSSLTVAYGQFSLDTDATAAQLEEAIDRCREVVLDSEQCSDERKWLVRHLIELRLRLQERKEADDDPEHPLNISGHEVTKVIIGHHFRQQPTKATVTSKKVYCDQCTGIVWTLLQAYYVCEDCGFRCHHKCIGDIVRVCAQVTAAETPGYEKDICPEQGLHTQGYCCAECHQQITLYSYWNEARLCDYSGKYYCPRCHWNTTASIPARVIHNWDLAPRPVSQAAAQLLHLTIKRPLLALGELNPRLFGLVHELSLVQKLREQLILMKRYLVVCRVAREKHLLSALGDRPHMAGGSIESISDASGNTLGPQLYSMQDLIDTYTGALPRFLQEVIETFTRHIRTDCEVCSGRGHLCELCGNSEVIFPFDEGSVCCSICGAAFHRACWIRRGQKCSRCERRQKRSSNQQQLPIESSDDTVESSASR